jgi:hypothetical protein
MLCKHTERKVMMRKPTGIELQTYAREIGYFGFDHNEFLDHYESNGWRVGKAPMKDWKAAVRNWRRRESEFKRKQQPVLSRNAREQKINQLNRRKAELMRMPDSLKVRQELEQIRVKLAML